MSTKFFLSQQFLNFGVSIIFIFSLGCSGEKNQNIIIENTNFRYVLSRDGKNLHFTEKQTENDLLFKDTTSYCAYIIKAGQQHTITDAGFQNDTLYFDFKPVDFSAKVLVSRNDDHINFKVIDVKGQADAFNFINIPLILEGMTSETFAACALSMNLVTHVRQLPALQTHLWASCYARFGMKGAELTIVGVPQEDILPAIRAIIKNAEEIPFSDKGGAWAQLEEEGYGSYLMDFGSLTEETVGETIRQCKKLGFNQMVIHGGGAFYKHGEFELDRSKWPDGWQSFKRINDRLHEAGIASILLTYTFFIDKRSHHVTPVPSEDLGYFNSFTLAETLKPEDDEIIVNESTAEVSPITGFFVRNSRTLRIGNELIEFNDVTTTPPYKFTGLTRGVSNTKVLNHSAGENAYHLREMFGLFVPGPETPLFSRIAERTAEIIDECGFDGIYFDAIDGNDLLAGRENAWYYGTKFIFEVAGNLNTPVGMEMCDMPHHYWHYSSRWQAWDRPTRGYKRFIDIHLAAIKSDDPRHGEWMGHTPKINKLAPADNGWLLLPLHLGWWRNYTWDPPQIEPTFTDDIEYLCSKMIGNNAGLSMLGGVDERTLKEYPLFDRLTEIIRQYEELRHQKYFNDSIRELLRQPGKEFKLIREETESWNFKPVAFQRHKVEGADSLTSHWVVSSEFANQPVKLRIEPLMSVQPFDHADNVLLADFSEPGEFTFEGSAQGVSGRIEKSDAVNESTDSHGGMFYAKSTGESPRDGAWIKMEKRFEPMLNLKNNQALGVWVKGDGNGQLLNLRIESPEHISMGARGDHFIHVNFTGWKYFELVEIESSRFNDYIWPDEYFNVYNSYFYTVHFDKVDKLQLWYNNLPANRKLSCVIGPVKAMPMISATIRNPAITIGSDTIVFPVEMKSGMYLEFYAPDDCVLYGSKGEVISKVEFKGNIPELKQGSNEVSFICDRPEKINPRVQVTVIGEGKPL